MAILAKALYSHADSFPASDAITRGQKIKRDFARRCAVPLRHLAPQATRRFPARPHHFNPVGTSGL
jgi:hypothetical protein